MTFPCRLRYCWLTFSFCPPGALDESSGNSRGPVLLHASYSWYKCTWSVHPIDGILYICGSIRILFRHQWKANPTSPLLIFFFRSGAFIRSVCPQSQVRSSLFCRFSPEALGMQAKNGLLCWLFQVLLLEATLHTLGDVDVPLLDIVAYGGYPFAAVSIALLSRIVWSHCFYVVTLWECLCMGMLLVKILKRILIAEVTRSEKHSSKCHYLLLLVAAAQFPLLSWLGNIVVWNSITSNTTLEHLFMDLSVTGDKTSSYKFLVHYSLFFFFFEVTNFSYSSVQ